MKTGTFDIFLVSEDQPGTRSFHQSFMTCDVCWGCSFIVRNHVPQPSVEYKTQQFLVCARLSEEIETFFFFFEIETLYVCEEHMEGVGIKSCVSSPGLGFSWEVSSVWMGSLGVSTDFAAQLSLSPPAPATVVIIQTHWEGPALLLATHMWWGEVGSLGPWRYFTGFYVCFWWLCRRHQTAVIITSPFPFTMVRISGC